MRHWTAQERLPPEQAEKLMYVIERPPHVITQSN